MANTNEQNKNEKKVDKKWILIGAGGVALLVGGYFIGKKIGKGDSLKMSTMIGDVARDTIVTNPIPLPAETTNIWKQIDEEVFTEIALDMENALINNGVDALHIDRSWEVADGVIKDLVIDISKRK